MLSTNELAVLRVLWDAKSPLSRPEILERISNTDWNPNSIHMVLNNLIKKGFITVTGVTRCGQRYGRTYSAVKTQADYASELALSAIPELPSEESVLVVMSAMTKGQQIGPATIEKLQSILDQRRAELSRTCEEADHKE